MVEPSRVPGDHNLFICGNDAAAKKHVTQYLSDWFGWKPDNIIDVGDITAAREKTVCEMLGEFAPAHRLTTGCEIGHRFVQIALIEKQMICVLQRHISADFPQSFESCSNMGLCLVLEKGFIPCLT
jgi:hypothetical protein